MMNGKTVFKFIEKVLGESLADTPLTSHWGQQKIRQILGDTAFEDDSWIELKRKRIAKLEKLDRKISKAKRKRKELTRYLHC